MRAGISDGRTTDDVVEGAFEEVTKVKVGAASGSVCVSVEEPGVDVPNSVVPVRKEYWGCADGVNEEDVSLVVVEEEPIVEGTVVLVPEGNDITRGVVELSRSQVLVSS